MRMRSQGHTNIQGYTDIITNRKPKVFLDSNCKELCLRVLCVPAFTDGRNGNYDYDLFLTLDDFAEILRVVSTDAISAMPREIHERLRSSRSALIYITVCASGYTLVAIHPHHKHRRHEWQVLCLTTLSSNPAPVAQRPASSGWLVERPGVSWAVSPNLSQPWSWPGSPRAVRAPLPSGGGGGHGHFNRGDRKRRPVSREASGYISILVTLRISTSSTLPFWLPEYRVFSRL